MTFALSSSSSPIDFTTCGPSSTCRRKNGVHIANETLEIYAPLAGRLGMGRIQTELEDLCFRFLQPEAYSTLAKRVESKRKWTEGFISEIKGILEKKPRRERNPSRSERPHQTHLQRLPEDAAPRISSWTRSMTWSPYVWLLTPSATATVPLASFTTLGARCRVASRTSSPCRGRTAIAPFIPA